MAARGAMVIAWFEGNPAGGGIAHTTLVISRDGGRTWHQQLDPCGNTIGKHEYDATDLTIGPGGTVAALCVARFRGRRSHVAMSHDAARHFHLQDGPPAAFPGEIAVFGARGLAVGTSQTSGRGELTYDVAVSHDGGRRWHAAVADEAPVYGNERGGGLLAAVKGRVSYVGEPFHLWRSGHNGRHWRRVPGPR
ncbi:MAG TPA: sialidase family protein [Mycobacteriales bacterium]|nr:sialidase family protein [Mycobacteriales bacterium]